MVVRIRPIGGNKELIRRSGREGELGIEARPVLDLVGPQLLQEG